jgi:hypothetical protein
MICNTTCHILGGRLPNTLQDVYYSTDFNELTDHLGLVLNEFLDYNITAKAVAASANRVLCLVIAKCKVLGGVV